MTKLKALVFLVLCSMTIFTSNAQTPAFPGAEGGGMYTTGGRGGTVYYVNTLADNSTGNTTTREGSLRWCINQTGKRTIMFKVGGIIELKSTLKISKGDVTIAGQTAPGDGICIKDYEMVVDAENVIVRYMRFRLGDLITTHEPDALWGRYRRNIIIDHCSVSWSIDECSSFYSNENFTMQWCFIAESLNSSIHDKGNHGYGAIWGGQNATFHHNLLAHHNSRNPRFNGWKRSGIPTNPLDEERVDYRNNVLYNWGDNGAYGGETSGKYNIVANYYKYGPATKSSIRSLIVNPSKDSDPVTYYPGYGQFYITDNYVFANSTVTSNNWDSNGIKYDSGLNQSLVQATTPFECLPITQHTAEVAFGKVLEYGGMSLSRDAVDARIANEVLTGTTTYTGSVSGKKGIIDSQSDVGGWPLYNSGTAPTDSDIDGIPDGWLNANYPGKTATDLNAEGYTYLELYLASLVQAITEGQNKTDNGGGEEEEKTLFCESIPTSGSVPTSLTDLISAGGISIASGRTDGCTENGYTWRTSDVTFTLPAKTNFSVNLTSNGTRIIYITKNGDTANKIKYTIGSQSCEAVSFDLSSDAANTLRIESYNSTETDYSQFSMTNLCIKERINTGIEDTSLADSYYIANDILYVNAKQIDIYSISGVCVKSARNINQLYIGGLSKGIYIVRIIETSGKVSTLKFNKK